MGTMLGIEKTSSNLPLNIGNEDYNLKLERDPLTAKKKWNREKWKREKEMKIASWYKKEEDGKYDFPIICTATPRRSLPA